MIKFVAGIAADFNFQFVSITLDALFQRPRGSSIILVISTLWALREDQLCHLNDVPVSLIPFDISAS